MQNSPFLNDSDFITWLANKAWIISIDDDSQINIKLLRDEAFVVIPEQLPELVLNRDLIINEVAQAVYIALSTQRELDK